MKKINNFWNWFLDNQYTIKNFMNHTAENQETICYWIKQNLNCYSNEIDFILVFANNNKSAFIIATNKNSRTFKKAIALLDNASVLKDWKLTASLKSKETIQKRLKNNDIRCNNKTLKQAIFFIFGRNFSKSHFVRKHKFCSISTKCWGGNIGNSFA